jgi:chromosome segregation ATPase
VTTDDDLYEPVDTLLECLSHLMDLYRDTRRELALAKERAKEAGEWMTLYQQRADELHGKLDNLKAIQANRLTATVACIKRAEKAEAELATLRTSVQPAGLSAETQANDVELQRQIAEAWRERALAAERELATLKGPRPTMSNAPFPTVVESGTTIWDVQP